MGSGDLLRLLSNFRLQPSKFPSVFLNLRQPGRLRKAGKAENFWLTEVKAASNLRRFP